MWHIPWSDGICLDFRGDRAWPRYAIQMMRPGKPTLFWTGKTWEPDAKKALLYEEFEWCRDDAWELKDDWLRRH